VPANLTDRPWWLEPLSEAAGDLSAEVSGLSSRDAKAQLGRFGPNLFRERQEKSLLEQYCRRAFKFDHLCALNFDQG